MYNPSDNTNQTLINAEFIAVDTELRATSTPAANNEDSLRFPVTNLERERALLERERDLLRRERELFDRERSMTQSGGNVTTIMRAPYELAERLLPEFDPARMSGLSATQWAQRIESVATAYAWDDTLKLMQAVNKLRGAAKLWMDGLVDEITSWEAFKRQLLRSFPSVCDQADVHLQLTKRKKEKGENYESYVYAMRAISRRGNIDNSSLIKYILNGLGDRELARSLALCEFLDIEELLRKIKRLESVDDRTRVAGTIRSTISPNAPGQVSQENQRPNERRQKAVRCYNCQGLGHIAQNCNRETVLLSESLRDRLCEKLMLTKQNQKMSTTNGWK
ncbi:hypothetical protein CBL_20215 [Carabus blaptoides fortunei]